MNSAEPPTSEVEELLKVVGDDIIRAYRDKYFPARIIQACPSFYSIENVNKWINVEKFLKFVAYTFQQMSPPASPKENMPNEDTSDKGDEESPSQSLQAKDDQVQTTKMGPTTEGHASKRRKISADTVSRATPGSPANGNNDESRANSGAALSSSTPPLVNLSLKRKSASSAFTKQATKLAAGLYQVTRQSWVEIVKVTTEILEHWPVPDSGASIAYILDLTNDPNEYLDVKGNRITMSALIKQKCTDAWAGGTGGSLSKATTVPLLGKDVKCQKMSHDCRGVFLCSRAAPELWRDYHCEDRDAASEYSLFGPQEDIFEPGFDPGHFERPVIFYNNIVKDQCPFDDGRCPGRLEYKHDDFLFPLNNRQPYIGCSTVTSNETAGGHLFHPIPSNVDHTLLIKLVSMGRIRLSDALVFNRPCTFTVPPRTGYKQKVCPHIHVQDGAIYDAPMEQRSCPAKITIFAPIDHSLRKAVIVPAAGIPHNHPFCPWDKRTRKEKAAARTASATDATLTPSNISEDFPLPQGQLHASTSIDTPPPLPVTEPPPALHNSSQESFPEVLMDPPFSPLDQFYP